MLRTKINMYVCFVLYLKQNCLLSSTLQENAEADSFCCFVRLLSDSVDHFCQQLDNSSVGIHSTLSRLLDLLKANDEELWRHLEFTTKVNLHQMELKEIEFMNFWVCAMS